MEYKGIDYLRRKLGQKRTRVLLRYNFYEMKNVARDLSPIMPAEFQTFHACLGWCGKAVDSLADRLNFQQFREDNFGLTEIYQLNNADVLFGSAINSALIASCCFIYISQEAGFPVLQVLDGSNATGIVDETTGLLNEGYAVLERSDMGSPTVEAYFTAAQTEIYYAGRKQPEVIPNPAPYPLLVPVIYRPDAKRPFGHSRISRACMQLVAGALRTIKRSEISAEFYSFPQKYILGMDPNAEQMDTWKATVSTMIQIDKDEDGDKPVVGQFTQQSMSPYTEQIRTFASLFAGETGLTLDDLGFVTDNPSSAEAIKASHENLRLAARRAQKNFGVGFLNAGYLAACVRDDYGYRRNQLYRTTPVWDPVFEPDSSMLAAIGDGIGKLNQAIPGYIGPDSARDLTGIKPEG